MTETLGQLVERVKNKNALAELLAQVEASSENTQVKYKLHIEIGKQLLGWHLHEHKAEGGYDTDWAEWRYPDGSDAMRKPHDWTEKFDDGLKLLSLVLPGWSLACLGQMDGGQWHAELRKGAITAYSSVALQKANRPALALVKAILEVKKMEHSA